MLLPESWMAYYLFSFWLAPSLSSTMGWRSSSKSSGSGAPRKSRLPPRRLRPIPFPIEKAVFLSRRGRLSYKGIRLALPDCTIPAKVQLADSHGIISKSRLRPLDLNRIDGKQSGDQQGDLGRSIAPNHSLGNSSLGPLVIHLGS